MWTSLTTTYLPCHQTPVAWLSVVEELCTCTHLVHLYWEQRVRRKRERQREIDRQTDRQTERDRERKRRRRRKNKVRASGGKHHVSCFDYLDFSSPEMDGWSLLLTVATCTSRSAWDICVMCCRVAYKNKGEHLCSVVVLLMTLKFCKEVAKQVLPYLI